MAEQVWHLARSLHSSPLFLPSLSQYFLLLLFSNACCIHSQSLQSGTRAYTEYITHKCSFSCVWIICHSYKFLFVITSTSGYTSILRNSFQIRNSISTIMIRFQWAGKQVKHPSSTETSAKKVITIFSFSFALVNSSGKWNSSCFG